VLKWICERIEGTGQAIETPIGCLPASGALDVAGLNVTDADITELLAVDIDGWKKEAADVADNYQKLGSRLPAALAKELSDLQARLRAATLPDKT